MKQSLFKIKDNQYSGVGTWLEFMTKSVQQLFRLNQLNPEDHVVNVDDKKFIIDKKRRQRGMHVAPGLLDTR